MSRHGSQRSIFVQLQDPTLQRVIISALLAAGWQLETEDKAHICLRDADLAVFEKPFRLGRILDHVENDYAAQMQYPDQLAVGRVVLQAMEQIYSDDHHTNIRLTDKERAVVFALLKAPNFQLLRDDLLRNIWGYVEGIETHTLETTIYRLRQKIERDADKPERLLTIPDGYKFNPY